MANFNSINRAAAFNPTSAFPLDARCYFESLEEAAAAAATAEEAGSSNTVYYYGQPIVVVDTEAKTSILYLITPNKTLEKIKVVDEGFATETFVSEAIEEAAPETITVAEITALVNEVFTDEE